MGTVLQPRIPTRIISVALGPSCSFSFRPDLAGGGIRRDERLAQEILTDEGRSRLPAPARILVATR